MEGGARGLDRAAAELRITWEALANITARVAADAAAGRDRLQGLRRIGIDEKSWGKGQDKYLVIVTDHDAGRVAWIGEKRCQATVEAFFADLGPERAKLLTHVSADGAEWIHPVVRAKAPQAQLCLDAFHVVKWAGEKLDELRRRIAGELRAAGHATRPSRPRQPCHCRLIKSSGSSASSKIIPGGPSTPRTGPAALSRKKATARTATSSRPCRSGNC